jgi:hypothetical protein
MFINDCLASPDNLPILQIPLVREPNPLLRQHLHLPPPLRIRVSTHSPLPIEPPNEEITRDYPMTRHERGEGIIPQRTPYGARGPFLQCCGDVFVGCDCSARNCAHVVVYCPLMGRYTLGRNGLGLNAK